MLEELGVGCAEERIARKHCIGPRTPAARSSVSRARSYKSVGRVSVFEDVLMRPPSSAAPTTKHGSCPKSGGPPLMSSPLPVIVGGWLHRALSLCGATNLRCTARSNINDHVEQYRRRRRRAPNVGSSGRLPSLLASSEPPLGVTSAPALLRLFSLLMSTNMSLRKHRSACC
jgi:hypothetical protein